MKKIILIILVIIWASIIFLASEQNAKDSNSGSKSIIYNTVKVGVTISNKLSITNIDIENDKWLRKIVNKLNHPIRKLAHFTLYLIFSILIILLLESFEIKYNSIIIITIITCFLYSLTDEFHQTFINGRTGQFTDCLIDTFGCIFGIIINFYYKKIKNKKNII